MTYVVRKLGEIGDKALIFGGPYSNLQATRALIEEAGRRKFSANQVICTGDTVAYCADPEQTVAALRTFGCEVVAGNCEAQLARDADDCGCGFEPGSQCDLLSAGWFAYARSRIDKDTRDWMRALPDVLHCSIGGRSVAVIHGGVTDRARFLWPTSVPEAFEEEVQRIRKLCGPIDMVIAGHCGVPFFHQVCGIDWINAGVIGMPPHDGRQDTRYLILGPEGPTFHRLVYDYGAAARAMENTALPRAYEVALRTGIWPDEAILPDQMRRTGSSLNRR